MLRYVRAHVEYPSVDQLLLMGPQQGVMYSYVPSYWLDVLLHYSRPVKAWLLERYRAHDPAMLDLPGKHIHLNLNEVDDDVVILARLEESDHTYFLMWYDCDVSDCQFLFFVTDPDEPLDDIVAEVKKWLKGQCSPEHAGKPRDKWESLSRVFDFPIEEVRGVVGTR